MDQDTFDVRPVGANVIIEPMEDAEVTPGGLHIPDIARHELKRGRVVAAGAGRVTEHGWIEPAPAQVGEIVIYGAKWQGDSFERNGKRYRVLEPEQTLAVVEDEAGEHLHRMRDAGY